MSAAAITTPMHLQAQDQSQPPFSVPTTSTTPAPTTTPSRAPQGPADERFGVPIGPRVIPQRQTPSPTPTATQAPSQPTTQPATQPATRPTQQATTPGPTPTRAAAQSPTRTATQSPAPSSATRTPSVRNPNAQGAGIGAQGTASPGFETLGQELDGEERGGEELGGEELGGEELGETGPRTPDGWYSVDDAGEESATAAAPVLQNGPQTQGSIPLTTNTPGVWDRMITQSWLLASLIALVAALGGIIAIVWLRRKQEAEASLEAPATVLTAGVRASMGEEVEKVTDEAPAPKAAPKAAAKATAKPHGEAAPQASPAPPDPDTKPIMNPPAMGPALSGAPPITAGAPLQVDLALDLASASRSLMRLSVEFSLEITNLSPQAVKNLEISGELACAQEGATSPAPVDKTMPIAQVDRIAPKQSRRVKGTLQMPIQDITAIRQNGRPVVIPLIHFKLGVPDQTALKRTFVVGTPSASSPTRVHPLMFEGPPGGLPPLRAQLIKQS